MRSIANYALEFGVLAAETGWDKLALQAAFYRGLGEQVQDALFAGTQPADLDGLIDRAIEIINYQRVRRQERFSRSTVPSLLGLARFRHHALRLLRESCLPRTFQIRSTCSWVGLVSSARISTKLDLRNAYHLVQIRHGEGWKTAFNTPLGHFKYLVMPFGLTNAPAVFHALVNDVLCDMLNKFLFAYIDDILIFSETEEEHILPVRLDLRLLVENSMYVKAEK